MQPTRESVSDLAYDLWIRRGRQHGDDLGDWLAAAAELRFFLDYELLARVALDQPVPGRAGPRCRICERSPARASFQAPPPIWPGHDPAGLRTGEICDDCQAECRQPLATAFDAFWGSLRTTGMREAIPAPLAALKAVATSLILIAPENELEYLSDAIEWLGNPDLDDDAGLFGDAWCRVYWGDLPREGVWTALARRRDDAADGPYLVGWLGRDGLVVETAVPLCLRDQDREALARSPQRSFVLGGFPGTGRVRSVVLSPASLERA